jgi:hypothetical protein
MKTSKTLLFVACCTAAGLTYAQDGEKRPGGDGGNRMAEFLKRIDGNADGKVSKDEFLAFSKKEGEDRFAKIDANADGVADEAEMKAAAEKMRSGGRPEGRGASEGGGFRRPPEGQGRPEGAPPGGPEGRRPEGGPPGGPEGRRPEGGPPGGAEGRRPEGGAPGFGGGMRGMMQAMGNPEEAFKKLDKNADGSVDLAEYKESTTAEVEGRFKMIDQNTDGKVTTDEFKGAMERMRGMMSRGMQGGPGGQGGPRRPGGEGGAPGGEGSGFRRPPSQDGDAPKPEPKKEGGV